MGQNRGRVSALILAKNEAWRISRCLASIAWVDEIVVVDDMSTDATADVCRRHGARVVQRCFDNFADQANFGLAHVTGDWVLTLDADEVVTPELAREIRDTLAAQPECAGFTFKRENHFLGHRMRYGGWHHDVLHLFRKDTGQFRGRVHYAPHLNGSVGSLKGGVAHYPFQQLSQFIERQNRYSSMEADELFELHGDGLRRAVRSQAVGRPLKLFWKFFVKKQGFREGMHGLVFSALFAWVHLLKWSKYWERCNAAARPGATTTQT